MKIKQFKYSFDQDEIRILPIGDLHIGSPDSFYAKFASVVEDFKDCKIVLLGDLLECITRESVGNIYMQEFSPEMQVEILMDLLTPVKDRVLVGIEGNHERRIFDLSGFRILRTAFDYLNIPYGEDVAKITITLKGQTFNLLAHHGFTASSARNRFMLQNNRYFDFFRGQIDVYMSGHVHYPSITPLADRVLDPNDGSVFLKESLAITCPAFVQTTDYAIVKLMSPSSYMFPIIKLSVKDNVKYISAEITHAPSLKIDIDNGRII